jgi:uncharacterized glyoxalase superfamily metalloenzyme YdcJ
MMSCWHRRGRMASTAKVKPTKARRAITLKDPKDRDIPAGVDALPIEEMVTLGVVSAYPMVYEDFLPVSAAGIFQSNLGGEEQRLYDTNAAKQAFVEALGVPVLDEFHVYEQAQLASIAAVRAALRRSAATAVAPALP